MSRLTYVHNRSRPGPAEQAIVPEAWFFATDISIAGCSGSEAESIWGAFSGPGRGPIPSQTIEVGLPSVPDTIDRDEEPSWPEDRYFSGNDIY